MSSHYTVAASLKDTLLIVTELGHVMPDRTIFPWPTLQHPAADPYPFP